MKCTVCGGKVSSTADICPHCGAKDEVIVKNVSMKDWKIILLTLIVTIAGFYNVYNNPIKEDREEERVKHIKAEGLVSKKDFRDKWPLTVSSGRVECIRGLFAVFHHKNKIYALNGSAISKGYTSINPIWKDNPNIKGTKINIGILTDEALKLCK